MPPVDAAGAVAAGALTHSPFSFAKASQPSTAVKFDVPAGAETGASTLVVIANGIASAPVSITVG